MSEFYCPTCGHNTHGMSACQNCQGQFLVTSNPATNNVGVNDVHQTAEYSYRYQQALLDMNTHTPEKLRELLAERKAAIQPQGGGMVDSAMGVLAQIYGRGYRAGHEDTVEGRYTDVAHHDHASYWLETVQEMLDEDADLKAALNPPKPVNGDGGDVRTYDVGWKIRGVGAYNRAKAKEFRHPECVEAAIKAAPPLETVRSVSDADVRQCLSVWRKSPIHMDAEQTMRAVLEAFLKGGEGHE